MASKRNKFLLGLGAAAVAAAGAWIYYPTAKMQRQRGATDTASSPSTLIDIRKVTAPVRLMERHSLTHDTDHFRFSLPSPDHVLGLPAGQHVVLHTMLDGHKLVRVYTPVSSNSDKGIMDIIVKLYRPCDAFPEGGKMSKVLDALRPGDSMEVSGPVGKFFYLGNGKLGFKTEKWDPEPNRFFDVKKVIMLAGGSGLAPMLQLVKHVLADPTDGTQLELLFANKTEDDIILRDHLDELASKHPEQLRVWYTLDKAPPGWEFSEGFVSADMIKATMSPPGQDTFVLVCGPKRMIRACMNSLASLEYPREQIHIF